MQKIDHTLVKLLRKWRWNITSIKRWNHNFMTLDNLKKTLFTFWKVYMIDMFPCSPSMIAAFKCFLHCRVTFTLTDLLLSLITMTKLWFYKWLIKDLPFFIVYNLIKGLPEKSTFWCTASSVLFLQFPRTYTIHFVSQ